MSNTVQCENWKTLYRNDRIGRVRFAQIVCLGLAVLCAYMLHLALYGRPGLVPSVPVKELLFVAPLCLAGILLPSLGMAAYLRRYVLSFEVCGEHVRLATPRLINGRNMQEFKREDFLGNQYEEGRFVSFHAVMVHAPWTWLLTRHSRYILDEQSPGVAEVTAWVATGL